MPAARHWLITLSDPRAVAPPPPEGPVAPNPFETVWHLGLNGVITPIRVTPGYDTHFITELRNNGIPIAYAAASTLEAVVWRGDDQPPLLYPSVTWISAPLGTLQMLILGSQTTGLEPGYYRIRVGVAVDAYRFLAYDGDLEVAEVPGPDVDRVPYVTYRDLLLFYDQLPYLQNLRSDETGFREQRVFASDDFDRRLLCRYNPRPGYIRSRNPDFDGILGYDRADPALIPPTKAELTGWLQAQGLVVEQDAKEIISRLAIALILDRAEVEGPNPYREEAQAQRAKVAELWDHFAAQVDAVPLDGQVDWLIGRDATFLPAGAAP